MKGALPSAREAIGHTPIIHLEAIAVGLRHRVYGKCEFMNPGGSVKDRIGFYLIDAAERAGSLRPGGTIIEATAGNTGMALAMAAARKGYRLVAVMTTKASSEKVELMRELGAEVHVVPYGLPSSAPGSFINYARALAETRPGAWYVDQFHNVENFKAHYHCTGPEIYEQTGGEIDVLVGGVGTGGTLCGAGAYLKEHKPSLLVVLADPVGSIFKDVIDGRPPSHSAAYRIEGVGGDFVPGAAEFDVIDVAYRIADREAIAAARALLRSEGLFVGGSAGCIVAAALRFCEEWPGRPLNVVAILPDGGRSYLSTIYNAAWRTDHDLEDLEAEPVTAGGTACT